jgi:hypothetical protein
MNKKTYTIGVAAVAAAATLATGLNSASAFTYRTRVPGEFPLAQSWSDSPITGFGSLSATLTLGTWTSTLNVTSNSGLFDSQFQWACQARALDAVNHNSVVGNTAGDASRTCAIWEGTMTGVVGMIDDL